MTNVISNVAQLGRQISLPPAQGVGAELIGTELPPVPGANMPSGTGNDTRDSVRVARQSQLMLGLDSQHQAAAAIKHAQVAFEQIGKLLGQMDDALQTVRKQYPPFPLESRERMELLNSISGLRRQIDALTFPPPDQPLVSLIGDSGAPGAAGDLVFQVANQPHVLHRQPAHAGPEGLDLPNLGPRASAGEVDQALERVQLAKGRLLERQTGLETELRSILATGTAEVDRVLQASRVELAASTNSIGVNPPA